jgi:hypothetical protein
MTKRKSHGLQQFIQRPRKSIVETCRWMIALAQSRINDPNARDDVTALNRAELRRWRTKLMQHQMRKGVQ